MKEAILIMTSESKQAGLRSAAPASGWSRLYQSDDFYFDLSLKPADQGVVLMGQVLASSGGPLPAPAQVALVGQDGAQIASENVQSGSFRIAAPDVGGQRLEVQLDQTRFFVNLA